MACGLKCDRAEPFMSLQARQQRGEFTLLIVSFPNRLFTQLGPPTQQWSHLHSREELALS